MAFRKIGFRGELYSARVELVIGFNHRQRLILTIDPAAGWRESSFEAFATEWVGAEQLALVVFRRST